ncbi:MAG: hypothetical protein K2X73_08185 [Sphingomonas sp.]|uniref:hypothetical protein n=1 Tax=Sphingomonas sp. TaxID=28214 RepID=UPI0025D3C807|nr:hypothetical protein [Sphingomonas sp.]MBX9881937.1 hypothetical protein [Sphingomonas sp.]
MSLRLERLDAVGRLALAYAPRQARAGLAALFMLDDTLAAALRLGRDPAVRQLRLTWWYEALGRLDTAPPPPEPLLQALAAELLPRGVRGAELATLTDGWDVLLNPDPLSEAGLLAYAEGRGRVFTLAARVLGGAGAGVAPAGQGWALAELAGHVSRVEEARAAAALAAPLLAAGLREPWPRPLRPLAMIAAGAEQALRRPHAGALARLGVLLRRAWLE